MLPPKGGIKWYIPDRYRFGVNLIDGFLKHL